MLLDEPLSNLDANLREEMRFEIRRLHEEFGITTIYVTHDQAEAMVTSDRIVVLNKGRMVQVGTPSEVFDQPRTRFVAEFIGKTNILSGRLAAGNALSLGPDLQITIADGTHASATGETFVSIRPHNFLLTADPTEARALASKGFNLFSGVLERRVYSATRWITRWRWLWRRCPSASSLLLRGNSIRANRCLLWRRIRISVFLYATTKPILTPQL